MDPSSSLGNRGCKHAVLVSPMIAICGGRSERDRGVDQWYYRYCASELFLLSRKFVGGDT